MENELTPDPEPQPAERWAVRALFAAVVLALLAQAVVYLKFRDEPYPALFMPGFRGAGGHGEDGVRLSIMEAVLISPDGSTIPVSYQELLEPVEWPQRGVLSRRFFTKPPEEAVLGGEPEPRPGFRYRLMPGIRLGLHNRFTSKNLESLREWLARRAEVLAPGRDVDRVEIRWKRGTFRLVDEGYQIDWESEPAEVWVIALTPGKKG
ncbi:hypothetical protein [Tautonia plasticadhaerens]|uniref:Uncharacterized protein n=1 Tax=Tautonia plasticadhaerens TaxID=2527974 RepID=A0A518HDL4_9BACT|nr:hypothetical protein [Tautonia plasticadhaerens]QDV38948.1 hypothetical protein ElP_69080 [Tautonia plasticadhaerens]